jgi:hypothetical protein
MEPSKSAPPAAAATSLPNLSETLFIRLPMSSPTFMPGEDYKPYARDQTRLISAIYTA